MEVNGKNYGFFTPSCSTIVGVDRDPSSRFGKR